MQNNNFVLKNRVRELRARLKMRQADLAREVDVTRQTILAIEKGRLNPSVMVSLKIARILREPVGYVFYIEHVHDEAVHQSDKVFDQPRFRPTPEDSGRGIIAYDFR